MEIVALIVVCTAVIIAGIAIWADLSRHNRNCTLDYDPQQDIVILTAENFFKDIEIRTLYRKNGVWIDSDTGIKLSPTYSKIVDYKVSDIVAKRGKQTNNFNLKLNDFSNRNSCSSNTAYSCL